MTFFLAYTLHSQYPLSPQNVQHTISGTVGESRQNRLRYHAGVDISGVQGESVYAIEAGNVQVLSNSIVQIGRFRYIHLSHNLIQGRVSLRRIT